MQTAPVCVGSEHGILPAKWGSNRRVQETKGAAFRPHPSLTCGVAVPYQGTIFRNPFFFLLVDSFLFAFGS